MKLYETSQRSVEELGLLVGDSLEENELIGFLLDAYSKRLSSRGYCNGLRDHCRSLFLIFFNFEF